MPAHEASTIARELNDRFRRIAALTACALGSPWAFATAVMLVLAWAATGPALGYSDYWQLVINTGTTIATFLMLFVVQNSQNRDTKAINIKLDELLRAIEGARTALSMAGELSDEELDRLEQDFRRLAARSKLAADTVDARSTDGGETGIARNGKLQNSAASRRQARRSAPIR